MKPSQGHTGVRTWLVLFVVGLASVVQAEDVTVTTYYPSPRGNYQTLNSTDATNLATTTGNVGIGTATPGAKLDVIGTIRGTDLTCTDCLNAGDIAVGAVTDSELASIVGLTAGSYGNGTNVPQITVDSDGRITAASNVAITGSGVTGSGTQNYLTKWNNAAGTTIGNSAVFENLGNVGIGTATPGAQLNVTGSFRVGTTALAGLDFQLGSGDLYLGGAGAQAGNLFIKDAGGTLRAAINSDAASYLPVGLGIGTTTPTQALHVVGSARITGLNAATCDVKSDTSGNLSCGTDATGGGGVTDPAKSCPAGQALQSFDVGVSPGETCVAVGVGGGGWTDDGTTVRLTTSTDNVGIGTTSPSGLQVNAFVSENKQGLDNVRLGVNGTPRIILDGASSVWEIDNPGNSLRIFTPGFVKLTIDSAGRVDITGDAYVAGQRVCRADGTGCPASGGLPAGALNQTLRHNGTSWVADSNLVSTGTNVGIGINPGAKLDVNGTARLGPNGVYDNWFPYSDNNAYVTGANIYLRGGSPQGWASAVTINTSNGRVEIPRALRIGSTNPAPPAAFGADGDAYVQARLFIGTSIVFEAGDDYLQREIVSGNTMMTARGGLAAISSGGTFALYGENGSAGGWGLYCNGGISGVCGGNKPWSNISDARLKTDIAEIPHPLESVMALRGVTFLMKDGDGQREMGFLAQEVDEALPGLGLVTKTPDDYYALKTSNLTAVLVEAVKEQQREIEELRGKSEELEGRLQALEEK